MLFRSTGLGKTMLTGHILGIQHDKDSGDYLILQVDTTDPVKWRVRAALSCRDMLKVVGFGLKPSIISLLLSPKQWFNKNPKNPDDF